MDRNQRMIMLALPIVFVAFIINFPAGLMVYWITTNCWTIVQQMIVRKTVGLPNRNAALATAGAPAGAAALTRDEASPGSGRAKAGRVSGSKGKAAAEAQADETAVRSTGGPPPSARRRKKRSGRRR